VVDCSRRVAVAVGMLLGCIVRAGRSKVGARGRVSVSYTAASPAVEQTWRKLLLQSRQTQGEGAVGVVEFLREAGGLMHKCTLA
jgi:hypothetical protein